MAAPILGKIKYHAGASGTVTLDKGEKMLGLWCVATGAGATVTVAGGDAVPLVPGIPFAFGLESRTPEWVGVAIVFSGTASYFVKSLGPVSS